MNEFIMSVDGVSEMNKRTNQGDAMTAEEFEELYEKFPDDKPLGKSKGKNK